jgi:hypothetical protein
MGPNANIRSLSPPSADLRTGLSLNLINALEDVTRRLQNPLEAPEIAAVYAADIARAGPFLADEGAKAARLRKHGRTLSRGAARHEFADDFIPVGRSPHAAGETAALARPERSGRQSGLT